MREKDCEAGQGGKSTEEEGGIVGGVGGCEEGGG